MKVIKYPAIKLNITGIAKEIIKIFWPNKKSIIVNYLSKKYYTDMYIRAKLTG